MIFEFLEIAKNGLKKIQTDCCWMVRDWLSLRGRRRSSQLKRGRTIFPDFFFDFEKNIFFGAGIFWGYSFDVKKSDLSISEVFSLFRAL